MESTERWELIIEKIEEMFWRIMEEKEAQSNGKDVEAKEIFTG